MIKQFSAAIFLGMAASLSCGAQQPSEKEQAITKLRHIYANRPVRMNWFRKGDWRESDKLLQNNGSFSDLAEYEKKVRAENLTQKSFDYYEPQRSILQMNVKAYARLWQISEALRSGQVPEAQRAALRSKLYKAAANYGDLEVNRISTHTGRWTDSPFFMPAAAVNIYFSNFDDMERAERGEKVSPELLAASKMLPKVAFQAWTEPMRKDETDKNVVSLERFRHNTFYVGGNAMYRPLLETALLMKSVPMMDVVAGIATHAFASTNQKKINSAFWNEGITSDGAGWGHGRQSLVWGYPTDGVSGALGIFTALKGTPWSRTLPRSFAESFLNFVRGSSFYYYRGHANPLVSRDNTRERDLKPFVLRTRYLVTLMLDLFGDSFTASERQELSHFLREANHKKLVMKESAPGLYTGIRYFFNNDDILCKNERYYMMCNMSAFRTDGLESGSMGWNMFANDGATIFSRNGREHREAFGAWDPRFFPGVTSRRTEKLNPSNDWSGYSSKVDFAGAATDNSDDFAAGFIFDKYFATWKYSARMRDAKQSPNPQILGVSACKSYFKFGDVFLMLGSNITDTEPANGGTFITTIEQVGKAPDFAMLNQAGTAFRNNGFAYAVLPDLTAGKVRHETANRPLTWEKMHRENKKINGDKEMFQFWIDHGTNPRNATYGYIVSATGGIPSVLPVVLGNTAKYQAAISPDGKTLGAVIYDSNVAIDTPWGILQSSAPCVLLIQNKAGKMRAYASDPKMGSMRKLDISIGKNRFTFAMPQGDFSGNCVEAIPQNFIAVP